MRGLVFTLVIGLVAQPAVAPAYDIKPKTPETAFAGKLRPDILGISPDSTAESARAIFDQWFKGRTDTKTDIQHPKFGNTAISFTSGLTYSVAPGPTQTGEVLIGSFSSLASGNRAYFIARNLIFAQGQQPAKADMIKEVMGKYGMPTIVGDQHLYYIYRGGSIVSVGAKYKEATAIDAIDKPLDPRAAIKLNGDNGRGSCVAGQGEGVGRPAGRGKGRQLRRRAERAAHSEPGGGPRRDRPVHPAGRHHQRGRDRRRGACRRTERTQRAAQRQCAETVAPLVTTSLQRTPRGAAA